MKDQREIWYSEAERVSVTIVDVTSAAQELVKGHLCGPTSAYFLTRGLAAAALLGSEMEEKDEVLSIQMKCTGPLGGLNVECTSRGTLRGYTVKKILDDFDGMGMPPDEKGVVGSRQVQVTRSVPGHILSQGVAHSLDDYLRNSLQRKARIYLEASVSDEVEVRVARGVLVEILPDSSLGTELLDRLGSRSLSVASRTILKSFGVGHAELKRTDQLSFACTCSRGRAEAMLRALGDEDRKSLPAVIDVTCHMCGRTFSLPTASFAGNDNI